MRGRAAAVGLVVIAAVGVITAVVFTFDPALDLRFAALFYDPAHHAFVAADLPLISGFRQFSTYLVIVVSVAAAASVAVGLARPGRSTFLSARAALFMLATLAVGPGLLVNGVLKEHWARPRPAAVTQFGGTEAFMPWWDPRGSCDSNCSFVSGEVSSAFWLLAPAAVVPPPWRVLAIGGVIAFGAAVGLLRAAVGGHFLTDIIFAAVFTSLIIWVTHGLLFRWPRTRVADRTGNGKPAAVDVPK